MRRMIKYVLFIFCALALSSVKAQNTNWESAVYPGTNVINEFYTDTTTDLLYFGAGNYFKAFDGAGVTNLGGATGPVRSIIRYNGILYVGTVSIGNEFMWWNGMTWDTTGLSANGAVLAMYIFNGELYVGGNFTQIGGINATGIAKFDGIAWSAIPGFPFGYCYGIGDIISYNGELYIGGNFGDSLNNVMNIARWNGAQWNSVGGGFYGGMDEVACFSVCNNILYIGGMFKVADGNVGDYIAQWDGMTLSEVGGGVAGPFNTNGQVFDLLTYHNELYACGVFSYAGGIFADRIAKWDGTNWCGFGDTLNNGIIALAEYHDTLFIGGAFSLINGDTILGMGRWIGGNYVDTCGNTTGIAENNPTGITVSVYPNPVSQMGTFHVNGTDEPFILKIYDQLGREIWQKQSHGIELEFSTEGFAPGLYYYIIYQNGEEQKAGKLIID